MTLRWKDLDPATRAKFIPNGGVKLTPAMRERIDRDYAERDAWVAEQVKRPIFLPLHIKSTANVGGKLRRKFAEKKSLREMVYLVVREWLFEHPLPETYSRLVVTLTRYGPRTLDDDNLAFSFKAVRDAVAKVVGIDDGKPIWDWRYAQEQSKWFGFRIEIQPS